MRVETEQEQTRFEPFKKVKYGIRINLLEDAMFGPKVVFAQESHCLKSSVRNRNSAGEWRTLYHERENEAQIISFMPNLIHLDSTGQPCLNTPADVRRVLRDRRLLRFPRPHILMARHS